MILSQKGWIRARTGHGLDHERVDLQGRRRAAADARVQDHRPGDRARRLGQELHPRGGRDSRADAATARRSTRWSTRPPTTSSGWARATSRERLLMNSSAGLGFICKLGDLVTKTRQGKDFMKVDEGATRAAARLGQCFACRSACPPMRACSCSRWTKCPSGRTAASASSSSPLPESEKLASVVTTDGKSLVVSGIKRKKPRSGDDGRKAARRAHRQARAARKAPGCGISHGSVGRMMAKWGTQAGPGDSHHFSNRSFYAPIRARCRAAAAGAPPPPRS